LIDSVRYFALELCEASLDKLFLQDDHQQKCRRRLPPREDVLYQLATGLEYIHKMGMTHRDIKPENVLIWVDSKDGQVIMKWADFGLSKKVNERGTYSMSTTIKGSENWFAPEVLKLFLQEDELTEGSEGSALSPRQRGTVKSDVYAEGLVFGYFYLDGEHIFGNIHSKTKTISNNIMKNIPVNISSKCFFLNSFSQSCDYQKILKFLIEIQPEHVHNLILKMLASVPERRITSSDVVKLLAEYRTQVKTQRGNVFFVFLIQNKFFP
jgi:serine/threonine-protein kinase/endoribonuclease IRE1